MPGSTTGNILCHFLTMGQTTQPLHPRSALLVTLLLRWYDGAGNLLSYRQQHSSRAAGSTSSPCFGGSDHRGTDGTITRARALAGVRAGGSCLWHLKEAPNPRYPQHPLLPAVFGSSQQVWGLLCLRTGLYCTSTPMLASFLQTSIPSEAQLWKGLHQVPEQHPEHRHCIEITLERWSDQHTDSSSPK